MAKPSFDFTKYTPPVATREETWDFVPNYAGGGNTGYNASPAPQGGQGPFGKVPGNVGIPPSLWEQATTNVPGLTGLNTSAMNYISKEIGGELTPAEEALLQRQAAKWGWQAGQPMTTPFGIATNKWDTSALLATMNREKQGVTDYQSLLGNIAQLQTNPAIAADIAKSNAIFNAAPDPNAAFDKMNAEWQRRFDLTNQANDERMQKMFDLYNPKVPGIASGVNPGGGTRGFSIGGLPPINDVGGTRTGSSGGRGGGSGGRGGSGGGEDTTVGTMFSTGGGRLIPNSGNGYNNFGSMGTGMFGDMGQNVYNSLLGGYVQPNFLDQVTNQLTPWNMFSASSPYTFNSYLTPDEESWMQDEYDYFYGDGGEGSDAGLDAWLYEVTGGE